MFRQLSSSLVEQPDQRHPSPGNMSFLNAELQPTKNLTS